MGTVVGFLAAAYVPMGVLPDGVATVMSALPFAVAAMLFREPLTGGALSELARGNSEALGAVESFSGLTLSVGEWTLTTPAAVLMLVTVAAVFTVASLVRIRGRVR